jgi:hypothetical protein
MEKYYTVPELARIVHIEYHAVYYHINRKKVPVIRSGVKPNQVITIAHSDLAKFLLTVDWLMAVTLEPDHPFQAERQKFAQRYIQRFDLANQIGHDEHSIVNWSCLKAFPKPAIRNGWYSRKKVLSWLQVNRPDIFTYIKGKLN